jgi:hypothetical protein
LCFKTLSDPQIDLQADLMNAAGSCKSGHIIGIIFDRRASLCPICDGGLRGRQLAVNGHAN